MSCIDDQLIDLPDVVCTVPPDTCTPWTRLANRLITATREKDGPEQGWDGSGRQQMPVPSSARQRVLDRRSNDFGIDGSHRFLVGRAPDRREATLGKPKPACVSGWMDGKALVTTAETDTSFLRVLLDIHR